MVDKKEMMWLCKKQGIKGRDGTYAQKFSKKLDQILVHLSIQ
jgi:hypothetical protein